jgi:phosphatidylinositol glycan class V
MAISKEQKGILCWTLLHRCALVTTLYICSGLQTPFDSSAGIQLQLDATHSPLLTSLALPLLRWDTLHFLAMASPRPLPLPSSTSSSGQDPSQARGGGLQYENSFAFQPGIVWLLKLLGRRSFDRDGIDWNPSQAVILTSVVASVLSILQPVLLNR